MYKDILRHIAGIEVFPVLSLVVFVAVFAAVLIYVARLDAARLSRLASLPLDVDDAVALPAPRPFPQEIRVSRHRDDILDHDADGIREFDNDLPRWWLYSFYLTILFAAAYLVNFHVLPRPIVGHAGMEAEYRAEMAAAASAKVRRRRSPP